MTLGLFGIVINAGLLLLIAWLSDLVGITFTVGGFPPDFSLSAPSSRPSSGPSPCRSSGPSSAWWWRTETRELADALRDVARRRTTPIYAMDVAALDAAATAVRDAFPDPIVRQFSVKANDVPLVIGAIAARGFGANVVSRGEWAAATPGRRPRRPDHAGGRGQDDGRPARRGAGSGGGASTSLDRHRVARGGRGAGGACDARARVRLDVLYRLNPDVAPETQAGLAVAPA